ncbi:cytochrome P450 [Rhodofomes roseus]|uniref:Cytochrome P450 n=1 Tax=Rhodofomes roseus TaxID=34475 RepID=A0ABQ8KB08_9APHY|nr:cytochrome P450 [Rhodofomes roseus]KAH9834567.1 cytochrome P450 [Rhodofomes roseus]
MTMLVELLGWNPSISALPYKSESYRKHRRWIQSAFGDKDAVKGFLPLKTREMHIFLMSLMERPSDYVLHVKRFVAALAVETVYGHRIESLEDEHVTLMDQAMGATTATGAAGGTLVDLMPFLKYVPAWMPGAAYQRIAARGRQLVSDSHYIPYRKTRESMASEDAPASFMSALIEQATSAGRLDEEETDIIYAAGAIYSAATDTTKTVLLTFILAMVLHPEVYTKLQNEVDRVVGKDRLPSLEDRPDLTYVDCVLKETYRWNPPLPLGLPHYITEDDTYEGYHLPKDTTVLANLWSICREKDMWPGDELDVFRPERFLDLDAEEAKAMDPRQVVFGYGRRSVCSSCPFIFRG